MGCSQSSTTVPNIKKNGMGKDDDDNDDDDANKNGSKGINNHSVAAVALSGNDEQISSSSSSTKRTTKTTTKTTKRKHRKSLDPSDKSVVKSQEKWLKKEKKKVEKHAEAVTKEWEDVFAKMMEGKDKDELSKDELKSVFRDMGRRIDEDMFDKVFAIFDANGDGAVNRTEFMVAMLFLSYRGSAKDRVELAFRLFDTNRNDNISEREFSEMIAALIGTDLEVLLQMKEGHDIFMEQLKAEYASESLEFLDKVKEFKAIDQEKISIENAKALVDEFIVEEAPLQVNIDDIQRKKVLSDLEEAKAANTGFMGWTSLDVAYKEIVTLLEKDKLNRFKNKIRSSTEFASRVFEAEGVNSDHGMTLAEFRKWAEKNPNLFEFLDELQSMIVEEERKKVIAALKIQRLLRNKSAKKKKQQDKKKG